MYMCLTFQVGLHSHPLSHTAPPESGPLKVDTRHVHTLNHSILRGGGRGGEREREREREIETKAKLRH